MRFDYAYSGNTSFGERSALRFGLASLIWAGFIFFIKPKTVSFGYMRKASSQQHRLSPRGFFLVLVEHSGLLINKKIFSLSSLFASHSKNGKKLMNSGVKV